MVQRLKKAAKINDDAPPEFFTVRNMLVVALMQLRFEVELHSSAKLEEEPFFGPFISTLPQTFNHLPQNFQPYQVRPHGRGGICVVYHTRAIVLREFPKVNSPKFHRLDLINF